MLMKTASVSEQLEVNPTTVQRWVKYFNLPCKRNEHGHYLFTQSDLVLLRKIKAQLNQGLPMSRVNISNLLHNEGSSTNDTETIHSNHLIGKFDDLLSKIDKVERQLEEKASDVVSVQVLQHRNEIELLNKKIIKLQKEIETLKINNDEQKLKTNDVKIEKTPKRRWLASLLNGF